MHEEDIEKFAYMTIIGLCLAAGESLGQWIGGPDRSHVPSAGITRIRCRPELSRYKVRDKGNPPASRNSQTAMAASLLCFDIILVWELILKYLIATP